MDVTIGSSSECAHSQIERFLREISAAGGFVSDEQVIGRAWVSYWPLGRIEFLHPIR